MSSESVQITIRRPWQPGQTVFILGPGGVGKSTLGRELSSRPQWPLIDLDSEFCTRIQLIGDFISIHGYQRYRDKNLALARKLVAEAAKPSIFVTPSGFLAAEFGSRDYIDARALTATGYGIVLLPSLDVEVATAIVVERQLTRGFNLRRDTEERKFKERFPIYLSEGDALSASTSRPPAIADAVISTIFRSELHDDHSPHSAGDGPIILDL